ncbi:HemN family oxidoreductase [Pasteurella multocida subsp. multocida str. Anand1_buffalo]|nr:HemN family oxidoreductase [Pasteurella multocida subsp. multocida str. Anand1_buffalo]
MNRFRLLEAVPKTDFTRLTGLCEESIQPQIQWALAKNILLKRKLHGK